jgi:hypothetical protein
MSKGPPNLRPSVLSFSFPATRRRYGTAAVTSSGLVRQTGYTDVVYMMHIYDAPADVMERVFPGQEGVRAVVFNVAEPGADVRTASAGGPPADDILFRGQAFEVAEVSEWNQGAGGERSYLAGVAREVTR